jgi:hypothetical protein
LFGTLTFYLPLYLGAVLFYLLLACLLLSREPESDGGEHEGDY